MPTRIALAGVRCRGEMRLDLVAARERAVARQREGDACAGALHGRAAAEERDDHDHEEEILKPGRQRREERVDAAADDAADARRGRREQQPEHQHERRDAAVEQRVAHRLGHLALRLDGLFGDVAGRLEAVEDVDVGQHGHERGAGPPVAAEVQAERVALEYSTCSRGEDEAEVLVEAEGREREKDAERSDRLDVDAEARHAPHDLRADRVQDRRQHDDAAGDGENRRVIVGSRCVPNQMFESDVT